MKELRRSLMTANDWLFHGEKKKIAEKHRINYNRAKDLTIGRCAPRPSELEFVREVIHTAEANKTLMTI